MATSVPELRLGVAVEPPSPPRAVRASNTTPVARGSRRPGENRAAEHAWLATVETDLAADLWEHFRAGIRPTLLDLAAWHASARADRIVVAHTDGTTTQVPVGRGAETVAAVRAAASRDTGDGTSPWRHAGKAFVATVDQDRLMVLLDGKVADGSTALLLDGPAGMPWTPVSPADLAAGLVPLRP